MGVSQRPILSLDEYIDGVHNRNRTVLAQAITLIESTSPLHRALARALLTRLLPDTGQAYRVGITGPPGVGKSTFIEALGTMLVAMGRRVAVLAVDPSSTITGGSILGDKSRMPRLAAHPNSFIRPSPSGANLGGVARRTREAILLCEAAGFDVVLVETVGVGQSETMVADMVDFFLVLTLPGAGDELQGIKKGVLELADMVAVNKADGSNIPRAREAVREHTSALHYLRPRIPSWSPTAVAVSSQTGDGIEPLWQKIVEHREVLTKSSELEERRRSQRSRWMWALIDEKLRSAFREHPAVRDQLPEAERAVREGERTPDEAAVALLSAFGVESEGD